METEVLQPVWGYTTVHRTFCVGHRSRRQHKQWIWVRQGCFRVVLNIQFLAISELCTQKDTSGCTQCCNYKQQNDGWCCIVSLCHIQNIAYPLPKWKKRKTSTILIFFLSSKRKIHFAFFTKTKHAQKNTKPRQQQNPTPHSTAPATQYRSLESTKPWRTTATSTDTI